MEVKNQIGVVSLPALSFKSLSTSVRVVTHGAYSVLTPPHSPILELHIGKRRSVRTRKNFLPYKYCVLCVGNVNL